MTSEIQYSGTVIQKKLSRLTQQLEQELIDRNLKSDDFELTRSSHFVDGAVDILDILAFRNYKQ